MEVALEGLARTEDPNLLFGTGIGDDAGVYLLKEDLAIVQTVDFFTPIVDDPYDFGVIAAANALSDCYTLGAKPTTVLNIVAFPCKLGLEVLREILRGGAETVAKSGASIVGGHSIQDSEPKYGLAVTGVVHPQRMVTNKNAKLGDVLILNKPIGTGIASNLWKKRDSDPNPLSTQTYEQVIASMKQLQAGVLPLFERFTINATTDITGFGLLAHAHSVAASSNVHMTINSSVVPCFPTIRERAVEAGGGGAARNRNYIEKHIDRDTEVSENDYMLLHDAQTSGPILFSIPEQEHQSFLAALHEAGFPESKVIGHVSEGVPQRVRVTP